MKSKVTPPFLKVYRALDPIMQKRVDRAYREWRANEKARRFKQIRGKISVRIDRNYRALGYIKDDTIYWVFLGKHDDYDRELG